ncbi:NUDIX hydrolase [Bacillus shivajii]|uniref:NUDIX hydrolase n=1 Tax=Bacillus shivajii TaxID=1983719 RepID=UPI001CFB90BA|nr:NUDIX hydrolase [Bacillus shivajii]UCZ53621.1 NUDIX hydrolase [Bacillus shivajii]
MTQGTIDYARRIQAIAQAGLAFTKDPFDKERYCELMEMAANMMANHFEESPDKVFSIYKNEEGYPTPKLDVRGVIFHDHQILLVKEKMDDCWALPGGFCEVGLSLNENVEKEVLEEAGLQVKAKKTLAILDINKHDHPKQLFHYYKVFVECEWRGGDLSEGVETSGVQFFHEGDLPPLSKGRNTEEQIELLFQFLSNTTKHPITD